MASPRFVRTPKVDVIVVGAGIAGLTTAMKLLQKESALQIKILEASNAAGGEELGETFLGEIGGHWITEQHYHIWQLVQQLQVPTHKRVILAPSAKRSWDLDSGLWAPVAKYELKRYVNAIELRMCNFHNAEQRKPQTQRQRMSATTMHTHIKANLFFRQSRQFMASVVQYVSGCAPQHITYEEFMYVCSSHGGLRQLIAIHIECPTNLLEISSGPLVSALLDRLQSAELLPWRRVLELHQHRDYVEIRDSAFELHTAAVVVMAVPWECMHDMLITPKPPFELSSSMSSPLQSSHHIHQHQQQHQHHHHRRMRVTCMLARYTEAHWRNAGYSGSFMCNSVPPLPLLLGYEYRPAIYAALLLHEEGLGAWLQPLAFQLLAQRFGDGMLVASDYSERTIALPSLAYAPHTTPWHRVVFAHSSTAATLCRGTLSGAVQSAQRAAVNVLLLLRPQKLTWQDIAEVHGDINEGHHTRAPPNASWLQLWLSALNVYNVSSYTLLAIGMFVAVRVARRRIALNSL